jgi:hypothetical protein
MTYNFSPALAGHCSSGSKYHGIDVRSYSCDHTSQGNTGEVLLQSNIVLDLVGQPSLNNYDNK